MKNRVRRSLVFIRRMLLSPTGTVSSLVLLLSLWTAAPAAAEGRFWEEFPRAPGRSLNITSIGLDRSDTLWTMAGTGVYYWTGNEFRRPEGDPICAGQYLTGLYGGPDRGLYATQEGDKEHFGRVYLLEEGAAHFVTHFQYDLRGEHPGFYVSRDGRLFNWGGGPFRVFVDGRWNELSPDFPDSDQTIIDAGSSVHFYGAGHLYSVDARGRFSRHPLDLDPLKKWNKAALLGDDKGLVLEYGRSGFFVFHLSSGEQVSISGIEDVLEDLYLYHPLRMHDGSVWILARTTATKEFGFLRIFPNGKGDFLPKTIGNGWDGESFCRAQKVPFLSRGGSLWFGFRDRGMVLFDGSGFHHLRHLEDGSPQHCHQILEGGDGTIYVCNYHGIFAYNTGESIAGQPRVDVPPLYRPGSPLWEYSAGGNGRIDQAWRIGDAIVFVETGRRSLVVVNANNGIPRFELALDERLPWTVWVAPGRHQDEMVFVQGDRLTLIELRTGNAVSDLEFKHDSRINPISLGEDFILLKGSRGSVFTRVTVKGEERWSCKLPGYVMMHPTAYGPLLLTQTRQGSYGGQATSGIDLNDGTLLWTDTVNAYGHGVAFGDDARYSVETDSWLSPAMTKGRLIARNPYFGYKLWDYVREGTTACHQPIVDQGRDRVYAVFNDGGTVCLDGLNGEILWKTLLPEPPNPSPGSSDTAYWPGIVLAGNWLIVLDQDGTLNFLDAENGQHRFRLTLSDGERGELRRPVAPPWFVDETMVVALRDGIAAYSFGEIPQAVGGVRRRS